MRLDRRALDKVGLKGVKEKDRIFNLVSSDPHEWRNDFPTVSNIDSAKLNSP